MQWLQYVLAGLILLLLLRKFIPMKGLVNLSSDEVKELLKKSKEYSFIDVREVHEFRSGHIRGFKSIPLSQLKSRIQEIDPSSSVVLTCRSGMRSRQAAKILLRNGFKNVNHLKTGLTGWHDSLIK